LDAVYEKWGLGISGNAKKNLMFNIGNTLKSKLGRGIEEEERWSNAKYLADLLNNFPPMLMARERADIGRFNYARLLKVVGDGAEAAASRRKLRPENANGENGNGENGN
jgi:hypothetical protein